MTLPTRPSRPSLKQTRLMMGMPITVEIAEPVASPDTLDAVFDYFEQVDDTFSTYKDTSEISRINRGELDKRQYSEDVSLVFALSEQTRLDTDGYFNIWRNGQCDPSGLVKGWAIHNAEAILRVRGHRNYFIDAGGDIAISGLKDGRAWRVGIRSPFNRAEIVKVLALTDLGIATSGTAIRGQHIYNPHQLDVELTDVLSLTVIGPNVYEADRFATAAFAMGQRGITFIEHLTGFEGYVIDAHAQATFTSGFERHTLTHVESD